MMLVISPHLDDAVFSCGEWLAAHPASTVVTVFAGMPDPSNQVRDWDRRSGFDDAAHAIRARCLEDDRALALLGARAERLDFVDAQYAAEDVGQYRGHHESQRESQCERAPPHEALTRALAELLRVYRPSGVLLPLGLFHSDHVLVHESVLAACRTHVHLRLVAYEDCLYRCMPGLVQDRLAWLRAKGVRATPAFDVDAGRSSAELKALAVQAYASQLRAFGPGGCDDAARPERFWELEWHPPDAQGEGAGMRLAGASRGAA